MIHQVSNANFEEEVLKSEKPVLVDFYADWCGPCKMMVPVLSQISGENLDKIKVCKVNIDENTGLAMEYRVLSIPTLAFFKDGELKGKLEGAVPKSVVEQKMEKYFS